MKLGFHIFNVLSSEVDTIKIHLELLHKNSHHHHAHSMFLSILLNLFPRASDYNPKIQKSPLSYRELLHNFEPLLSDLLTRLRTPQLQDSKALGHGGKLRSLLTRWM